MKDLIIRSFGFTVYDHQSKFHNSRQGDESFSQFVLQLKENLSKMEKLSDVSEDYNALREMIIKDKLLHWTDKNLAEYLKERDIFKKSLDDVVKLADNYQSIHGKPAPKSKFAFSNITLSTSGGGKYTGSGNAGSGRDDGKSCYLCGKVGHLAKFCRQRSNSRYSDTTNSRDVQGTVPRYPNRSNVTCFNCGVMGHYVKDCPNKRAWRRDEQKDEKMSAYVKVNFAPNNGKEYSCNLPLVIGSCNGKDVRILRDTGSTAVLVKSSLVNPVDIDETNMVRLKFADGSESQAKNAVIDLNCVFMCGRVEAVCLPNLPFDVLVGNVDGAACACVDGQSSNFSGLVQTRAQSARDDQLKDSHVSKRDVQINMDNISTNDMKRLQESDPNLRKFFLKAADISNNYPRFIIRNDVLVRLANRSKRCKDILEQIVLPSCLVDKVLCLAHNTVMSGHLGTRKTQLRVLNHFYWPGVYSDVSRFCRSCSVCQRSSSGKPAKVPLITLPIIETPFQRVAVDLIGPLPKSVKGNRYALVSVDLATKYPDAVPLKRIDSNTVAEALLEIYSRVGLPKEILHDQGTQFMSSVMRRFNQLLQIKSINTTPYNPRCNGTCENFNKSLKQMLKKITDEEPEIWDRYLQPLLFAYREVPQVTTGFSPFELLFGYQVRGPLFLIKEKILETNDDAETSAVTSYVLRMR